MVTGTDSFPNNHEIKVVPIDQQQHRRSLEYYLCASGKDRTAYPVASITEISFSPPTTTLGLCRDTSGLCFVMKSYDLCATQDGQESRELGWHLVLFTSIYLRGSRRLGSSPLLERVNPEGPR